MYVDKKVAQSIALSMYINEPCRICGVLLTAEIISDAVFAGYSSDNMARGAHMECWQNNPSVDGVIPQNWVHQ